MNVLFSSSDPSLMNNPRRSSAIYMYVTESMIKFLPLSFLMQSAKPLHDHYTPLVHEIWVHTRSSYMGKGYGCSYFHFI